MAQPHAQRPLAGAAQHLRSAACSRKGHGLAAVRTRSSDLSARLAESVVHAPASRARRRSQSASAVRCCCQLHDLPPDRAWDRFWGGGGAHPHRPDGDDPDRHQVHPQRVRSRRHVGHRELHAHARPSALPCTVLRMACAGLAASCLSLHATQHAWRRARMPAGRPGMTWGPHGVQVGEGVGRALEGGIVAPLEAREGSAEVRPWIGQRRHALPVLPPLQARRRGRYVGLVERRRLRTRGPAPGRVSDPSSSGAS